MDVTALSIGGFTQPAVARNLIELQASAEKGLSPRFLWLFPKPNCDRLWENPPSGAKINYQI